MADKFVEAAVGPRIGNQPLSTSVELGDPVYWDGGNNVWEQADADDATKLPEFVCVGKHGFGAAPFGTLALGAVLVDTDAPYTVEEVQYLSETAGEITRTRPTTAGAIATRVGRAITSSKVMMLLQPNLEGSHYAEAGTAALPSYSFADDPDSGWYRIGANNIGLALNGAIELNITTTAFSPGVSNGIALGTTALMWSDVFVATGAVINWNNGTLVLTQTSTTLAFGTAEGGTTAATGGTLRAPDLVTGGAGNVAGADLTLGAGLGTGTGDVGTLIIQLPIVASSGDNIQTTATRLTYDMVGSTTLLTQTYAQAVTVTTAAGDYTIAPAASLNVTLNDDDGDALDFANSATSYYIIDTQNTISTIFAHSFDTEDATFASASGARYGLVDYRAYTVNFTGNTQVTSEVLSHRYRAVTLAADGAGGDLTINQAATMNIQPATEGSNVIITDDIAIHIANAGGSPVTQHGILIDDMTTGATADYGITIRGADTAAIWIDSADPIQLGTAGSSTGTMNWQGATSGVVTVTVAAAAGVWTLTLPPDNGAAGEQLQTNGSGVTTWEAAGSMRKFKDVGAALTPQYALDRILGTQAYRFHYKDKATVGYRISTTGDLDTEYVGVMADEFPEVMHHGGRVFSPVSAFGYTVAAFQAQNEEIEALRAEVQRLRELVEV
jgi:hypothetical protein